MRLVSENLSTTDCNRALRIEPYPEVLAVTANPAILESAPSLKSSNFGVAGSLCYPTNSSLTTWTGSKFPFLASFTPDAGVNGNNGGVTASTEMLAARRHTGAHSPVSGAKTQLPTLTSLHTLLNQ